MLNRLILIPGWLVLAFPVAAQVDLGGSDVVAAGCAVSLQSVTFNRCNVYQVPSGKRLVIQTATAYCALTNGNGSSALSEMSDVHLVRSWGGSQTAALPITFPMQKSGSGVYSDVPYLVTAWTGTLNGPFYAQGQLVFEALRYNGDMTAASCRVTFDGYLVSISQ